MANNMSDGRPAMGGLKAALSRGRPVRDPFSNEDIAAEIAEKGKMRQKAVRRIGKVLNAPRRGRGGKTVFGAFPVENVFRLVKLLEKHSQDRDSKVGQQAHRLLSFLQEDQGGERIAGIDKNQLRKVARLVQRDNEAREAEEG